jgi:polar amino acid transport system substrate-binding protein
MLTKAVLVFLCTGMMFAQAGERLSDPALPNEIHLVSERWPSFTEEDGSGVAWEVLRLVFEPMGVKVRMQTVPYSRSVGLVRRGEADAWVGSYAGEVDDIHYPRWHFDRDYVSALGLADTPEPSVDSLPNSRLLWIRGYRYEHYLPGIEGFQEVQRRDNVLPMLAAGRVDYFIDARVDIDMLLAKAQRQARYKITNLVRLPLYLGFAETPEALALADLYDQRMESLVGSGQLRPIYEKWNWEYPFD